MSEIGRPVRTSKKDNKGVPPQRLGFSDEEMPLSRTPPQILADMDMITENRTGFGTPAEHVVNAAAGSAATTNNGAEVENRDVAEDVSRATTGNATSSHVGNGIEQIALEFIRKITDIQNEFQRQIHELSRIFADNSKKIQSSVQTLQQEMVRMAPRENIDTPTVSTQNIAAASEPLHLANSARPTESDYSVNSQRIVYAKIVNLPPFAGDPLEWPMFERSFIDTTKEFGYSNTRNIIRLREALHGESKVAVAALLPYPDSVPEIMNTLKENFGRPDQIINCQVMEIRKSAPIPLGNISLIIPFANKVKNMTACVRYAKAEQRLCDVKLLGELVSKIPIEEQMKWAEYK
ncbi:uncharacterized protein [Eurosta solidaginis]|uniref:uncharacterized protein isoform X2 n=1 Tax=Eurosta solidaginis TaxID=178769 RepID=UPI0035306B56